MHVPGGDVLSALAELKAVPFVLFSMLHSENVLHFQFFYFCEKRNAPHQSYVCVSLELYFSENRLSTAVVNIDHQLDMICSLLGGKPLCMSMRVYLVYVN